MALIISKLAIALALAVGAAAIGASTPTSPSEGVPGGAELQGMLVGVAVMLTAAFMPWLVFKVIPIFEAALVTQGAARAPLRGAAVATSTVLAASSLSRIATRAGGPTATHAAAGTGKATTTAAASVEGGRGGGPPSSGAGNNANAGSADRATGIREVPLGGAADRGSARERRR